jgi:hypothetical protein
MSQSKLALAAAAAVVLGGTFAHAAPYASGVQIAGNNVSFVLNEPTDVLTVSINGGAPITLDGSTAGTKNFTIGSPSDKFTIVTQNSSPTGYRIPTGSTIAAASSGLSQQSNEGGSNLISADTNVLNRFNSPRGVSVSRDPNAPNFGTAYIANSAAGTVAAAGSLPARTLGDGIYALRADQSDAFGNGDTAANPVLSDGFPAFIDTSASSPWRVTVGPRGDVYVVDFSDANGGLFRLNPNLTAGDNVLAGIGGNTTLPVGQNHGSLTATYVEGSLAGGNLTVYNLDEDLRSSQFGGPAGDDRNSLWRYDIGAGPLPYAGTPTKVNAQNVLLPTANSDVDRGADGKFYLAQNRSAGNEPGVVVLSPDGSQVLFNSLTASRALLGNPTAADILRNIQGIALTSDQQFLAGMLNNSDVVLVPLVEGIPDLANRLVVNTGTDIISGRDIATDIAGNIHYVSSGQGLYRVLSPGGDTFFALSYDGSLPAGQQFAFAVPEPGSAAVLGLGALAMLARRRRS